MAELKLFKRKQRYTNRSQLPNDRYGMASLQEVINFVKAMTENTPRVTNKDTKVGLYIELKDYDTQIKELGLDIAELTYALLLKNGLSTVADC